MTLALVVLGYVIAVLLVVTIIRLEIRLDHMQKLRAVLDAGRRRRLAQARPHEAILLSPSSRASLNVQI
jgi:hypothetical protein